MCGFFLSIYREEVYHLVSMVFLFHFLSIHLLSVLLLLFHLHPLSLPLPPPAFPSSPPPSSPLLTSPNPPPPPSPPLPPRSPPPPPPPPPTPPSPPSHLFQRNQSLAGK